jgi:lipopolysaccharide/colanic/teichoic acid biosynthesis glycosyltransferase
MYVKRVFDFFCALALLLLLSWLVVIGWILAVADTKTSGIFIQARIGQFARPFKIYKLRTMHPVTGSISGIGRFLRAYKIDELPQLVNVLKGDMSMVGPRPDIEGYYDRLEGEDRQLLAVKPGITGPATLKYAKEEEILKKQQEPEKYNAKVIFPDKVRINRAYMANRSLFLDIKILFYTVLGKQLEDHSLK